MQIPTLQELLEAGVHFGHKVSRGNPRMKPYIYGVREGVSIIDLTLSEKTLKEAADFVRELGKEGKILLFLGTKKQSQDIVKEAAKRVGAPFLVDRWIGGFLTNFEEISKNIKRLKELKEAKVKGTFEKYTKKEQLLMDRKISDLTRILGGVEDLVNLPDAIFIADAQKDAGAVKEASRMGIKIIAVVDSNADPSLVDWPIPGNDDAIKSIKILVSAITDAYEEGSASAKATADKVKAKFEKEEQSKKDEILPEDVVLEVAAAEEKIEKETIEEADRKIE